MIPFKNILIPVASPEHAEMAVEKAFELCTPADTAIYLVSAVEQAARAGHQLVTLREKLTASYPGCTVTSDLIAGRFVEHHLLQYIRRNGIDLVILVKEKNNHSLPSSAKRIIKELAENATIPILTITPGCLNHPVKSILLPVHSFVPEIHIQASLEFAKKYNAQIHLVTILGNSETDSKEKVDAFYLTYKLLTEYGHSPHYKILQGNDSTELLLRYADQVKADIILVSPEKKSSFFGFVHHQITDMLHPLSALQVLMLKPNIK